MATKLLDRAEFRAWLESNRGRRVGRARGACRCPVAMYLISKGRKNAIVGPNLFYIGEKARDLPEWAKKFVRKIDLKFGKIGLLIRGSQALRILDGIGE